MENNLRREDAKDIVNIILKHSNELNNFVEDRKEKRSDQEVEFLRRMIGRLKGIIYFEIIEVINEEFKEIMEDVYTSMPETKFEFPKPKRR